VSILAASTEPLESRCIASLHSTCASPSSQSRDGVRSLCGMADGPWPLSLQTLARPTLAHPTLAHPALARPILAHPTLTPAQPSRSILRISLLTSNLLSHTHVRAKPAHLKISPCRQPPQRPARVRPPSRGLERAHLHRQWRRAFDPARSRLHGVGGQALRLRGHGRSR
jgi:hypothetical protein